MVQLARGNRIADVPLIEDISASGYGVRPGASAPPWAAWQGGLYRFKFAVGDDVGLDNIVAHGSVPAANISVHVHWALDNSAGGFATDAVQWSLEYSRMTGESGAVIAAPGAATVIETTIGTAAAYTEFVSVFPDITMAGHIEGAGLIMQFGRIGVTGGGLTEYGDAAVLLRIDSHIYMEKAGTVTAFPPYTFV